MSNANTENMFDHLAGLRTIIPTKLNTTKEYKYVIYIVLLQTLCFNEQKVNFLLRIINCGTLSYRTRAITAILVDQRTEK